MLKTCVFLLVKLDVERSSPVGCDWHLQYKKETHVYSSQLTDYKSKTITGLFFKMHRRSIPACPKISASRCSRDLLITSLWHEFVSVLSILY